MVKISRVLDSIAVLVTDTLNKSNLMLIPPKMCSYSINKNPKIEITIVYPEKTTKNNIVCPKNRCFLEKNIVCPLDIRYLNVYNFNFSRISSICNVF